MAITLLPVRTRKELSAFIHLPRSISGKERPNWVPPVWSDERTFHQKDKNPSHRLARVERWLAVRDGVAVGRIMGIIHDAYNETHGEKTARFYALESINDPTVSHLLLHTAERWAKDAGMNRIIGPFGFSDKDPEGAQVEGLEYLPVISTATNPSYLPGLIEREGYHKHKDCVVYRAPVPDQIPELYQRIATRITERQPVRLLRFNRRAALKPYIQPVFELINETYKPIMGFSAMTREEMRTLEKQYLPILPPELIKIVVDHQDRVIAFVIAVPDFSAGLQRCNGHLFPFGFIHILTAMKRSRQLDLLLGAVHPDYQGKGLTTLLGIDLLATARSKGFTHMDSHLILEDNYRMRAEMERIGGTVYKRYRIFGKSL